MSDDLPFADIAAGAIRLQQGVVTQQFESLEALAVHMVATAFQWRAARRAALWEAARLIREDARAQIGHYQDAVGNYPAWEPLAESTEDEKARLGYETEAPLLREGDLRNSFRRSMDGDDAVVIGSTDPVMEYHEFGTDKMPPRPVIGPAALKKMPEIQALLGTAIAAVIVGQRMGYEFGSAGIGDAADED